jgi:hypothetical protein
MAMHLPTVIAVILLLLPISSTSADSTSPPNASQFYGCWEVSLIKWKPEPEHETAKYLAVPQRIFLSVKPAPRENTYLLLPAPGEPQTIHDDNYWQFEPNGGLRLSWRAAEAGKGAEIILEPPVPGEKAMSGIARSAFNIQVVHQDRVVVYWWRPGKFRDC